MVVLMFLMDNLHAGGYSDQGYLSPSTPESSTVAASKFRTFGIKTVFG